MRQRCPFDSHHDRRIAWIGPIGSSAATTGATSHDANTNTVATIPREYPERRDEGVVRERDDDEESDPPEEQREEQQQSRPDDLRSDTQPGAERRADGGLPPEIARRGGVHDRADLYGQEQHRDKARDQADHKKREDACPDGRSQDLIR
jgi:hypothetical protein